MMTGEEYRRRPHEARRSSNTAFHVYFRTKGERFAWRFHALASDRPALPCLCLGTERERECLGCPGGGGVFIGSIKRGSVNFRHTGFARILVCTV